MRLTGILLLAACLHVSASGIGQRVTYSAKNISLQEMFKQIIKQTGYSIIYNEKLVKNAKRVDIDVSNATVEEVLSLCFKDQPFRFNLKGKIVSVEALQEDASNNFRPVFNAEIPPGKIRGRVVDVNGVAVAGVSILLKGSQRGTSTDNNGEFTLSSVDSNDVLVISGINVETYVLDLSLLRQKIKSENGNIGNITVVRSIKEEKEIVVAYNRISEKSNTGAVTVVKGEQIASLPNRSFDKSLQGLVPGLLVTSGSGQPGGSVANFVLRGIATGGDPSLGETYRNPLVVIDGVPVSQESSRPVKLYNEISPPDANPLAQLNPSDVETVTVLKDASAIALYGSRASNGVILVTTKRGKTGKTVFTVRSQTDFSTRLRGKIKTLNQQEYLELLYETYKNSTPGITDEKIFSDLFSPAFGTTKFSSIVNKPGDTIPYPVSDWEGEIFRSPAITTSNEIGMSGGNDHANFYLNLEYTKQNGIVINSGFNRKSMRFNYDYRATKWFKVSLNTSMSYNVQDVTPNYSIADIMSISPLNPIKNTEGTYIYNFIYGLNPVDYYKSHNPVAAARLNTNKNTSFRNLSRISGELRFLKHFTLSSLVGIDYMSNEAKTKVMPDFAINYTTTGEGSIGETNTRTSGIITTNILRYEQPINKDHLLSVLAGQEAQIINRKYMILEYSDISANPDQEQITGKKVMAAQGYQYKQTMASYFGQLNYNFRNRYFLSGSIRTDGASQFGKSEKFGTYWSTGLGWVISEEPFMKQNSQFINYLKLRGSFGPAGNSAAILEDYRFDYYRLVRTGNAIAIVPYGPSPGNPGIKWEQTFTWDVGMEMRLAKERVNITADFYNRKTTNLIANNIPIPISTSFAYINDNIGDIRNQGIELSISADLIKTRLFRWNIAANWSRNTNKFLKAYYPRVVIGSSSGTVANEVGRPYNSFYVPVWAGVNKDNGRPQWVDSVTGKPTVNYFAARREFVGKTQPDGFGSLTTSINYKSFEISAMLYYQYGFQIYDNSLLNNDGFHPYLNQSKDALDRWQKPGDIAKNPRRLMYSWSPTEMDYGTYPSTRYLQDGDFIRLSNLQLSYRFSEKILNQIHLANLRVYVQGNNLATWTKYKGQDPENANGNGQGGVIYPQMKTISIGLNASF